MSWLLVRPDGTLRCFNRHNQEDVLQPGESWVEVEDYPGDLTRLRWDGSNLVSFEPPPPPETKQERDRKEVMALLADVESGKTTDLKAIARALQKVI